MATISKILIRDGTRALLSTGEVPKDSIQESMYKMRLRDSDQLQTVLAMYEQETTEDRSRPSCQKLKTMVKRHKDQKNQNKKFQAINERIETGVLAETQKGRMSSLKRNQENADSGKQKDSVQKETLAVSTTTTVNVERKHNRPVLQGRRHKNEEEYLRKESPPRGSSKSVQTLP